MEIDLHAAQGGLKPSANGSNGELTRSANGQFAKGNCGGPGNPNPRRTAELRAAMFDAVSPDDLRAVLQRMVSAACQGDVAAARLILDRMFGRQSLVSMLEEAERPNLWFAQAAVEDEEYCKQMCDALEGLMNRLDVKQIATDDDTGGWSNP